MTDAQLNETAAELRDLPSADLQERLRRLVPQLSLSERFRLIHHLGIYHHPESASGAGSTLRETAALRARLPSLLRMLDISTVLDIPCGDFHWMKHVALSCDYTGADIVPGVVAVNQQRFGTANRRFLVLDASRDPLPKVDLVICRDLLIHLGNDDCSAVLRNIAASDSRFLLTNHFANRRDNPEIISGDFRPVNLCASPFSLSPPMEVISESSRLGRGAYRDRCMALWPISELAAAVGRGVAQPSA